MLVHPSGIDVSSTTLGFLSPRLHARHRGRGTRWRRLTVGRQALLALAHPRCGHTYAQLAAGFDVGVTTVCRYTSEAVDVLATLAPTCQDAVRAARAKAYAILDGTLLPIDRTAADRPFHSGKHKRHGMNAQVLAERPRPDGRAPCLRRPRPRTP